MSAVATASIDIIARDRAKAVLARIGKTMQAIQARAQAAARHARRMLMVGGAIAAAGVKAFMDFEKDMAMVSTMLSGKDMDWMKAYEQGIDALAVGMGESTGKLAKGLYDLLSASVPPAQAMETLRIATEAAKGGFTDTATSVSGLVALMNAYGLDAKYAGAILDKMFMTVKNGVITFEQLASSIGKAAPMARAAGMSMDQLLGSVAAITKQGVSADMAMTQIRSALVYAANAGMSFNDVLKKFKGKSLKQILAAGVDRRTAAGIAALTKDVKDVQRIVDAMAKSGGSRLEAFAKYQETFAFKWDQAKQSILGAGRALGKALLPLVSKAALIVTKYTKRIAEWIKANSALVLSIVKVSATVLGLIVILPKVLALIGFLGKTLIFLATTPIGLVITALGALAVGLMYLVGKGDTFVGRIMDGFMSIVKFADSVLGSFEGFRTGMAMIANQICFWIVKAFWQAKDKLQSLWNDISAGFKEAWEFGVDGMTKILLTGWGWARTEWSKLKEDWLAIQYAMVREAVPLWLKYYKWKGKINEEQYKAAIGYWETELRPQEAREALRRRKELQDERKGIKRQTDAALELAEQAHQDRLAAIEDEQKRKQDARARDTASKLSSLEQQRKQDLEDYLKRLAKLPKLSDKVKVLFKRIKDGLGLDELEKIVKQIKKDFENLKVPVPDAAPAAGGGKSKAGKYEALQDLAKRIAGAAAGGSSPELHAMERTAAAAEEQKRLAAEAKQHRLKMIEIMKKDMNEPDYGGARFV